MSWPPGRDDAEQDSPQQDPERERSSGTDDAAWDDWSHASRPRGPSDEPISAWDDWPPPEPEPPPEPDFGPERSFGDPWAESWEVEPARRPEPEPEPEPTPAFSEAEAAPMPWRELELEPVRAAEAEPAAAAPTSPPEQVLEAAPMPPAEPEPFPEPQREPEPPWWAVWRRQPEEVAEVVAAEDQTAAESPPEAPAAEREEVAEQPAVAAAPSPATAAAEAPEARTYPTYEARTAFEPEAAFDSETAFEPEPALEPETAFEAEAPEETTAEAEPQKEEEEAALLTATHDDRQTETAAAVAPVWGPPPAPEAEAEAEPEAELELETATYRWESEVVVPPAQPVVAEEPPAEPVPEIVVPAASIEPAAEPPPAEAIWAPEEIARPAEAAPPEELPQPAEVAPPAEGVAPPDEELVPPAEPSPPAERPSMAEPGPAEAAAAAIGAVSEDESPAGLLEPAGGVVETTAAEHWAGLERRKPTTAESAVPWLVGIILLLAGMVVVLMALIFSGDQSLGGVLPSPSPSDLATPERAATPRPTATPTPPASTPEATPPPILFGDLEMVYQGRSAALEPIYLLRRDFTRPEDAGVLAQDPALDVRRFAWAPDGSHGAALLAERLVSIEPDAQTRHLADAIITLAFGDSPSSMYVVRVSSDGANDTADVNALDYASAAEVDLAAVSYPVPGVVAETPVEEAQFADDGGEVRLYWMEDDTLLLWVMGAGAWQIDPTNGATTVVEGGPLPALWSPDGGRRIVAAESGTTTNLVLYTEGGTELAKTSIEGLVSHLRWSPDGSQVSFTLARGSVRQDLFLWNLAEGTAPMQLTNTGAAFGAEWLGTQPLWRP